MRRILFIGCLIVLLASGSRGENPPARVMLDDFSGIDSWLGRGGNGSLFRSAHQPFGSMANSERDDGFCGEFRLKFGENGGERIVVKNALYKTFLDADAVGIRFFVNPQGLEGKISLTLEDRNKKRIRTEAVPVAGTQWQEILLPLEGIASRLPMPFSVWSLQFSSDRACEGAVLIDDLAVEYRTLPQESSPIGAKPVYRKLGWRPGEEVVPEYRFRNRLGVPFKGEIELTVGDRKSVQSLELAPYASAVLKFNLGKFHESTALPLYVRTGGKQLHWGWVTVFRPNAGRVNHSPMWFAVEDQECNTAAAEIALHASWLPLLGVDMIRAGMGGYVEPENGDVLEREMREMWAPHIEAGVMLQIDYAGGNPLWTARREPGAPFKYVQLECDWEMFDAHMEHLARFFATMPEVRYFEFINEPNLDGFPGSTDNYLIAMKRLYPIFKKHAPEILVTTGGFCPEIPHAKPRFIERLLAQPESFDRIAYHEHAEYPRFRETLEIVKKLAGSDHKPIINTEAGTRSFLRDPSQFYYQAAQLVKKITSGKALGLEYYNWFMLQDYWDKYINADDSLGLVTVDNQPKPAFAAYAVLIRQLANREPAGEPQLDQRLEVYRFLDDREELFVIWNRQNFEPFNFMIRSEVPVVRTDIYGNETTLAPNRGIVMVPGSELPFYLRAPKGSLSPIPPLLAFTAPVIGLPGSEVPAKIRVSNPYAETLKCNLIAAGERFSVTVPARGEAYVPLTVSIPRGAPAGRRAFPVMLTLAGETMGRVFSGELSLGYTCALKIAGTVSATDVISLNSEKTLRELIFDPSVPSWAGPEDLSGDVRISYSPEGLAFDVAVRDRTHYAPSSGIEIWRNDCVQVGLASMTGAIREYTFSLTAKGAEGYCHLAPDGIGTGPFTGKMTLTRSGDVTHYRFTIPAGEIGIPMKSGTLLRMALLIGDNDDGKMARLMLLFDGIHGTKDVDRYGIVQLQ